MSQFVGTCGDLQVEGPFFRESTCRRLGSINLSGMGWELIANGGSFADGVGLRVYFSGVLFNRAELAEELGCSPDASAAQVVAAWWHNKRKPTPQELGGVLSGTYVVALGMDKEITLLVDPAWCGTVYYRQLPRAVMFASAVHNLAAQGNTTPRLDEDLWSFEYPVGDHTMFQEIHRLPAGMGMRLRADHMETPEFFTLWMPPEKSFEGSDMEAITQTEGLLSAACQEVPANTPMLLSGGLDSSVLAMLLRPSLGVVCRFPPDAYGAAYDEREYQDAIYGAVGCEQIVVTPTPEDLQEWLPQLIKMSGSIYATMSPLADFMMLRELHRQRYSAFAAGHGPDELLNGYARHTMLMHQHGTPPHAGDMRAEFFAAYPGLAGYSFLADRLWGSEGESRPASVVEGEFRVSCRSALVGVEQEMQLAASAQKGAAVGLGAQLSWMQWDHNYPSQTHFVTTDAEWSGLMPYCPYLDRRILEFWGSLPDHFRLRDGQNKWLLRRVAEHLGVPDLVVNRTRKMGLAVPAGIWLQGPLKAWADEQIAGLTRRFPNDPHLGQSSDSVFDRQRYKLLCMALWLKAFD